jgi:hypothetical protein
MYQASSHLIAGFEAVSILFAVVVGVPLFGVSAVIAIVLAFRRSRATGIRAALVSIIVGAPRGIVRRRNLLAAHIEVNRDFFTVSSP